MAPSWTPQFDSRIRRIEIDGVMHFSVLDVFQHYGSKANPIQSWAAAKRRLEKQGFDSSTQIVELQFPGERQRKTPVATFTTFLRIAQVTDFKQWEHIRQWMAEVAHERIQEEVNPELIIDRAIDTFQRKGKSQSWSQKRVKGIRDRKFFVTTATDTHIDHSPKIGMLTNTIYRAVFGGSKDELAEQHNFTPKQTENFRDQFGELGLDAVDTAELGAALKMRQSSSRFTTNEQNEITGQAARIVGPAFQALAKFVGIDLLSGDQLLQDGSGEAD